MKIFLSILLILFFNQVHAYDLAHRFGVGVGGGVPIPVFGNDFNNLNDHKWEASLYGRYHLSSAYGLDLGISHEAFKGSKEKFDNANLLGFWRMAEAADLTPLIGAGLGLTKIKNYSPSSLKLSFLARIGVDYGLSQDFSLAGLVDYQYVSKLLGDMPGSRAHVLIPQIALTFYFGSSKPASVEEKKETKDDVVSVSQSSTARDEEMIDEAGLQMTVEFDSNKSEIKPQFDEQLKNIADYFNRNREVSGVIEGHADSTGPDDYNKQLSMRRADAVKNRLIEFGVEESRLSSEGFGEEHPIADNSTAEGRQKNRRAIVIISIVQKLSDRM